MEPRAFGAELRALRALRGLTIAAAARRAGVSRVSLHRWEAGEQVPNGAGLAALLAALEAAPSQRAALVADASPARARPVLAGNPLGPPAHPGSILRALRKLRGATQAQLAQAVGVDQSAVAKWEGGRAMPTGEALAQVVAFLGAESAGLREDSLDLYEPIVSPDDARFRLRERGTYDDAFVRFMAIERELWPLAARDSRWLSPLAEALAFQSTARHAAGEFTVALGLAQRAFQIADAANAWDVVDHAVCSVLMVRRHRGADPSGLHRFLLDCAEKPSDPFVRGGMLARAAVNVRAVSPRESERLFGKAQDLVLGGEPTEFTGGNDPEGPLSVEELDYEGLWQAVGLKDGRRATELYERLYPGDWRQHYSERGLEFASLSVELHRLAGVRLPDVALESLDAAARLPGLGFWALERVRKVNKRLGLYVPPASIAR